MKLGFSKTLFTISAMLGLVAGNFALAQTATPLVVRDRFYLQAQENARSFNNQLENIRQDLISRLDSNRAPVTKALENIKDSTKRQQAQDIINETQAINLGWVSYYGDSLNQLDLIVAKVKSRREKARLAGMDITGSAKVVSQADQAIATARQELLVQAKKIYLPNVANLKKPATTSFLVQEFKNNRDSVLENYINFKEGSLQIARTSIIDAITLMSGITPDK